MLVISHRITERHWISADTYFYLYKEWIPRNVNSMQNKERIEMKKMNNCVKARQKCAKVSIRTSLANS